MVISVNPKPSLKDTHLLTSVSDRHLLKPLYKKLCEEQGLHFIDEGAFVFASEAKRRPYFSKPLSAKDFAQMSLEDFRNAGLRFKVGDLVLHTTGLVQRLRPRDVSSWNNSSLTKGGQHVIYSRDLEELMVEGVKKEEKAVKYVLCTETTSELAKAMIDGETFYSERGLCAYSWDGEAFVESYEGGKGSPIHLYFNMYRKVEVDPREEYIQNVGGDCAAMRELAGELYDLKQLAKSLLED